MLELIAQGSFDPTVVTTRVAPWDSAHEALHDKTTKVIVSRL